MAMMYPHLFSPLTIRGKTYRNRILVSPIGPEIPNEGEGGVMSDQVIDFYHSVAHGGCARVVSGENDVIYGGAVHGIWAYCEGNPTEAFKDSVRRYAKACHDEGALAFTSFGHMGVFGRYRDPNHPSEPPKMPEMPPELIGTMPPPPPEYIPKDKNGVPYKFPDRIWGPSDMVIHEPYDGYSRLRDTGMDNHDGTVVHGVSVEQMNEFADAFAHCASVAKECGLDGIVIHSGHGFMFAPWISERFNHRTDEYGGSFENRCRFPIMVLERIRAAVGEDFILEMRWSAEEDAEPLTTYKAFEHMLTVDDAVKFFQVLDQHPGLLDVAHITGGLHYNSLYNSRTISNFYFPEGLNVAAAAKVKAAVKNIKVGVVGGMTDPALCDQVIADGKVDFVIMARQLLIADPEFPNKAREGYPEDINTCQRCAECRADGHCTVNPVNFMTANDDKRYIKKDVSGRKLVIVGGGIGGMKAAEYAARRGFDVVLFEKENELGGILRYTDHDRFKTVLHRYKDNVAKRIARMGVDIRLGQAATPELVKAEQADAVIVATGGSAAAFPFPCEEGAQVLDATYADLHADEVGHNIVIVGAGLTGTEAAIHWADEGHHVTLLSRSPKILKKFGTPFASPFASVETYLIMLENTGVDVWEGYACDHVTKDGVTAKHDGEEVFFPADTVINASGMRPDETGCHAFDDCAPTVTTIGDCVNPKFVGDATFAAYQAVMAL